MTTSTDASPPRPRFQVTPGHAALAQARRPVASAVAIGNFDGVHRGHQRLFAEARQQAAALGGPSIVLTFDPHPARLLSPRYAPPLITTTERKLELIAEAGIELCVVEPFDRALASLGPDEFIERVVVGALGARHVCVGYDFTFGKDRRGGQAMLRQLGTTLGFGVTVIEPVSVDGIVCSSTKVREFVLEGRVEGAALLLGRDVEIDGEVVRGAGRGRTIGIPTANLRPQTELLPRGGVYAGWAQLCSTGEVWDAAINIGTNPTFTGAGAATASGAATSPGTPASSVATMAPVSTMSIEAHLLDFRGDRDLYGQRLRLGVSARLRDELRFPSVDALVAQIHRDIAAAGEAGSSRRRDASEPTQAPHPVSPGSPASEAP